MMHVYLGLADDNGLKVFLPETDAVQRQFSQHIRDDERQVAVWSVLDSETLAAIWDLLEDADYKTVACY